MLIHTRRAAVWESILDIFIEDLTRNELIWDYTGFKVRGLVRLV